MPEQNPTPLPLDALGHQDDILAAFVAYDRFVRWEEHNSRLDATEPIVERAQARGHIVALVANLAVAALQERLEAAEARAQAQSERNDRIEDLNAALQARAEAAERLSGELVEVAGRLRYADDAGDGEAMTFAIDDLRALLARIESASAEAPEGVARG